MPELRRPVDWQHEFDYVVLDPDGWRRDGKSWDEPITRDEYSQRLMWSTVVDRREALAASQSCSDCGRTTNMEDEFDRVCGAQIDTDKFCEGMFK